MISKGFDCRRMRQPFLKNISIAASVLILGNSVAGRTLAEIDAWDFADHLPSYSSCGRACFFRALTGGDTTKPIFTKGITGGAPERRDWVLRQNWPDGDLCGWGCPYLSNAGGGHDPTKLPLAARRKNEIFPANAGSHFFKTINALYVYVWNQAEIDGCFRLEQDRKLRALQDIHDQEGAVFDERLGEGYVILESDHTF